ncbi:hypothetical protein EVAR_51085_1 [Eumeta japonica]|uniref:Uncharacterized protein n=1 Tax=Eumeta variegata TaxID=151549 RepID=A0A4C1XPF3_EUMVA|nr:hypothetical protein EVAR_51085_1 [Eumeta japonica]
MKQRLLQLNLFLSEWKGRVPFTFLCLSLSLLGGLTMPEWKGRVPLTRSHCERITDTGLVARQLRGRKALTRANICVAETFARVEISNDAQSRRA